MTHRPLLALVALCSTVPLSLAAAPLEALPPGALEEIIVTATARNTQTHRSTKTQKTQNSTCSIFTHHKKRPYVPALVRILTSKPLTPP